MSYSKKLFNILNKEELKTLILNIDTKVICYKLGDELILTTITDKIFKNSYVVSPYALMINYGEDELTKIESRVVRKFYYFIIKFFTHFLKFSEIDKVQILNNYLFATNFFSNNWHELDIASLRKRAITDYPKHALIIRSVNKIKNLELFKSLCNDGWKAIVIRQVYIYDNKKKWEKSRNTKNDKKLLNSNKFTIEEVKEYERALSLYNVLYLDKHSKYNIHYSSKFFKLLCEKGLLKLFFLRDNDTREYVGVVGVTQEADVMTVPIIGYDMSYSKKDALYRRLVYYVTNYAFENDCLLNFSSGAPDFKLKRGAKAELEYMFVYDKHLGLKRTFVWKCIYFLSKYLYAPMLKKLKL